ncbi:MAG: nickel pincer cofactor biosynthesis protein LarB [Deltaproteobacteria bacterium]|nr:MAG: nickel pincer cofactor biosynthesis protein LarB [Deltaproteobacteria bacterium]
MNPDELKKLLQAFRNGEVDEADVIGRLRTLPFEDIGIAHVDHHRSLRQGAPEVIFGAGKTIEQLQAIIATMAARGSNVLATRLDSDKGQALLDRFPGGEFDPLAGTFCLTAKTPEACEGTLLVACAGTSDLPVAREAAVTARMFGHRVEELTDVGVAGIHRLLSRGDTLRSADVIIVVAGMEGALPSVVGGLVSVPVIAVPTSVGYGAAFGGIAALLGMLNSCAGGVTVVNIDNGFGAAFAAHRILQGRAR